MSIYHYITIDLESWIHRFELKGLDSLDRKNKDAGFIVRATKFILEILEQFNIKTTFFVVGEIFDWYPELIKNIAKKGHEIGFHSFSHKRFKEKKRLELELQKGEDFIQEFKPKGFRAPEMIFSPSYFRTLQNWGFKYDSSIYAAENLIRDRFPVIEIPVSTIDLKIKRINSKADLNIPRGLIVTLFKEMELPYGSGLFIGLLGDFIGSLIRKREKQGYFSVLDLHPWQLYPAPLTFEEIKSGFPYSIGMWPYYLNRERTFRNLLSKFKFQPLVQAL